MNCFRNSYVDLCKLDGNHGSFLYKLEHYESLEISGPESIKPLSNSSMPSPVDVVPPMESGCGCSSSLEMTGRNSNSSMGSQFVYAIGKVNLRFPNLGIEKELAQAIGRAETTKLTDSKSMHSILSKPENKYLVQKMCWVMTIEGQDAYVLLPSHPEGYDLLVKSLARPNDIDVVIGTIGQSVLPEVCNGLMVPLVKFDQVYSFDVESLIKSIPKPKSQDTHFNESSEELFWKVKQMSDNKGETDMHRALNYLAVRYPAIYTKIADAHASNLSLTSIHAEPSRISGIRRIVDVIFSFTHRQSDVSEKYFVRVDVTDEFPFLVTKMSPYYSV